MAKFDLSNVTLAFKNAGAAEESFALMCEDMKTWNASGEYPANKDLGAAIREGLPHLSVSTVKVYASRMLAWARIGKTPRSLHAMCKDGPKATGKGGRPPKAKVNPAGEGEKATLPNDDKVWIDFLESVRAQVAGRKTWASDAIVAAQDSCATLIALIKRQK